MAKSSRDADLQSTRGLLEQAQRGDRRALDQLCERHIHSLRRWARGRLPRWARGVSDTEDLVQDGLRKALRRIDHIEYQRTGAFFGYLREAVRSVLVDKIRENKRRPAATETVSGLQAREPSAVEALIHDETLDLYENALADLPPADRELVKARIESRWTYGEIARRLGKPSEDAARMATKRAMARLVKAFKSRRDSGGSGPREVPDI